MGELTSEDFVEYHFATHKVIQGTGKPSKEILMHEAIYASRSDIHAILHSSPLFSTMWACTKEGIPSNWFVEDMYYLERVARVPYCHLGSIELGDAVRELAKNAHLLLLENHGVLVLDTSIREARMALHTLEMVCKMLVMSRMSGIAVQGLDASTVADFLFHSGYKPARSWHNDEPI